MNNHSVSPSLRLFVSCLALATPLAAHAQDLGHKAPPQDHTVYITGATIHTVSGDTIENGGIIFEDGRITSILPDGMVTGFAPGTEVIEIDAAGLHVYPGLISPYSQLGLTEIDAVRATQDMSETLSMTPEVRAAVAVNPDSTLLPVTRSNGILLAGVFPTASLSLSGPEPLGLIPGRAALIRLDGWTTEDMAVVPDAGLVVNFPLSRPIRAWWMEEEEGDQTSGYDKAIEVLDEFFDNAPARRNAASCATPSNTATSYRRGSRACCRRPADGPSWEGRGWGAGVGGAGFPARGSSPPSSAPTTTTRSSARWPSPPSTACAP